MSQPQPCFECGCPLAGKSKGFALGSGDPKKAKMALLLETPASNEIAFLTKELHDGLAEMARRDARFPELADTRFTRVGAPVVGPTGNELFQWALKPLGLHRADLFIENVLHCWPPQTKQGNHYPVGNERKKAEGCCSQIWNRLDEFGPTAAVVNFHPAAIIREVTPLPIQIRAFERAKTLMLQGHRVVVCCGGKAADVWFGYASNVTRWAGHFQLESDFTRAKRAERWAENRRLTVTKTVKVKKLTAKTALMELLLHARNHDADLCGPADPTVVDFSFTMLRERYVEMLALCAPKPKKAKVEEGVAA
jgi:hypothetical protein